jgi:RNA polymerase sigma-70 factor (ECF subfamily)
MVLRARDASDAAGRAALEQLCRAYWRPLRAFAIRSGHPIEDAEDFTQEFFLRLLARNGLAQVSPEKGRFRNFLLVSFRNFLADQRDKARAAKRGGGGVDGGRQFLWTQGSVDGERDDAPEPVHAATPEQAFERQWAHTLLQRARARLRDECTASGRLAVFEALGPEDPAPGPAAEESYEQIGVRLGLGVTAVKSAAFRLRKRYRELIRTEVAETVNSVDEIDEELRHMLRVLGD